MDKCVVDSKRVMSCEKLKIAKIPLNNKFISCSKSHYNLLTTDNMLLHLWPSNDLESKSRALVPLTQKCPYLLWITSF